MRQYVLPTHVGPDDNFVKVDNTLANEEPHAEHAGAGMAAPLMSNAVLAPPPNAIEYYHQESTSTEGHRSDVFISPVYQDKNENVHLLDPPPPPPPSQDRGLQSQDHGPTAAAGRPYREQMVIGHYPPNPPPTPVWPQDIWVHSGSCRVMYAPVLVFTNPIPGQPMAAPYVVPLQEPIPPMCEEGLVTDKEPMGAQQAASAE